MNIFKSLIIFVVPDNHIIRIIALKISNNNAANKSIGLFIFVLVNNFFTIKYLISSHKIII